MLESLDRLVLAGLGALNMTREKAEKIFEDAVHRGEAQKVNQEPFVRDVMDSAKRARTNLEELISRQMRQTLEGLNLPTREDLKRVEAKLDLLLEQRSPVSFVPGPQDLSD